MTVKFPSEALLETENIDVKQLVDARPATSGITIDGPTSRDLDDGIHIAKTAAGWNVLVSIADVTAFVPDNSALDAAARQRVCTRYTDRGNIPMLPRSLAEGAFSLIQGRKRAAYTFCIDLDEDLNVRSFSAKETAFTSRRQMAYAEVDTIINERQTEHPEYTLLLQAAALAQGLMEKRRNEGALIFYNPSRGIITNEDGQIVEIPRSEFVAHIIVQEMMILVNSQAALWAAANDILFVFRNQRAKASAPGRNIMAEQLASAFLEPDKLLEHVQRVSGFWMNSAMYDRGLHGHFALGLEAYCHITSPIRRYCDVVLHRIMKAAHNNTELPYTAAALEAIAEHINTVNTERKQSTTEHFKGAYRRRFASQAQKTELYATMDDAAFGKVMRAVLRAEGNELVNTTLEQEFLDRLAKGGVPVEVLFRTIATAKEQEPWTRFKREIAAYLFNHPHIAITVLTIGTQQAQWICEFGDIRVEGLPHERTFTATLHAATGSADVHTVYGTARNKNLARAMAAVQVVYKFLKLPLPETNPETSARIPESEVTPQVNLIGQLNEFCQQNGLPDPVYEDSCSGPSHQPTFSCRVSVQLPDNTLTSELVEGRNKKAARQFAAQNMLAQLAAMSKTGNGPKPGQSTGRTVFAFGITPNPVLQLNNYCQRQGLAAPLYDFQSTGPDHQAAFSVCVSITVGGNIVSSETMQGKSKKEAQKLAAQNLLAKLGASTV